MQEVSFAAVQFKLFIFEKIAQSEAHVTDIIQIHDEILFGNSRSNKVGFAEQVQNINQQIIILQNVRESYDKQQLDSLLLLKANVADIVDSYFKTEDNALLLLKADKTYTYSDTDDDALLFLKADKSELICSYSKSEDDALLLLNADKTDSYSMKEDDAFILLKADKTDLIDQCSKSEDESLLLLKVNNIDLVDSYSKTEDDTLLLLKADQTDIYPKTEDDALLLLKADETELIDAYSKSEDGFLLLKADVTDLTNYVNLTSALTITGIKQFRIVSGGGNMLASSLVIQPQLQEVIDIATGKSKAQVFSTQGELNDWIAIHDNISKFVIGDELYIVDKEVTDY
ncbi:MAG: hypothetical protein EZS28_006317 [Streblomastix strix]|uniref:Uncharacterized protein n=1 Tax=Streblomastix strix TaxID=222440 RepID=A0A5J4WVE9_9EUKA|nr:MAG: hypothetical protein EZS28_006317 [Streblomastix strix]